MTDKSRYVAALPFESFTSYIQRFIAYQNAIGFFGLRYGITMPDHYQAQHSPHVARIQIDPTDLREIGVNLDQRTVEKPWGLPRKYSPRTRPCIEHLFQYVKAAQVRTAQAAQTPSIREFAKSQKRRLGSALLTALWISSAAVTAAWRHFHGRMRTSD